MTQHAYFFSIHVLDSMCLQIEQVQFVFASVLGFEKIKSSSRNCRSRSPDLTAPNNQYVERATSIIISIRLNKAKRRVNKNTPDRSIANPRTRIQHSGINALEFILLNPKLILLDNSGTYQCPFIYQCLALADSSCGNYLACSC